MKKTNLNLNMIKKKQYLIGHKINNINDKLFLCQKMYDLDIYKLYDYKAYLDKGYSIDGLQY